MRTRTVAALVCILTLVCLTVAAAQGPNPSADIAALRQAAGRGDLAAMFRLGGAYRDGAGVSQDLVEAHAWPAGAAMLATGADAKTYVAAAQYLAGRMTDAQLDDAEKRTFDGLQRLGAAGHPVAQFLVGTTYYTGHRMAPQDVARAAEWLRKAANQGERRAQFLLANIHFTGEGVARDEAQAMQWYTKSAAQRFPDAQYMLGIAYTNGTGVAEDQAKAVEWFRLAADQGDKRAHFRLGIAYGHGRGAVQDHAQVMQWIRQSAEQAYADAQFELAVMYEHGRGVPEDLAQAVKWYGAAAEQGDPLASLAAARAQSKYQKPFADARDVFAQAMTAEQIGEAQKRARAWLDAFQKRR